MEEYVQYIIDKNNPNWVKEFSFNLLYNIVFEVEKNISLDQSVEMKITNIQSDKYKNWISEGNTPLEMGNVKQLVDQYKVDLPIYMRNSVIRSVLAEFEKGTVEVYSDGEFLFIDNRTEVLDRYPNQTKQLISNFYKSKLKPHKQLVIIDGNLASPHDEVFPIDYYRMIFPEEMLSSFESDYFPMTEQKEEELKNKEKPYKFLSYNGCLHPSRLYCVNYIYKNNLDFCGLISVLNRTKDTKEELRGLLDGSDWGVELNETLDDRLYNSLPVTLDIIADDNIVTLHGISMYWKSIQKPIKNRTLKYIEDRSAPLTHFLDSYFSLVTETMIDSQTGTMLKITEKTYRALALHPVLIVGNMRTLSHLRSVGFKTFPEMFDESYDEIENDFERMTFVLSELKRLCEMSNKELHKLYIKCLPAIKHNQKVLMDVNATEMLEELYQKIIMMSKIDLSNKEGMNLDFIGETGTRYKDET